MHKFRCSICGDPSGGCSSLESATPFDGYWCPLLERALAARHDGVKRKANGSFPVAWYNTGAGTWGPDGAPDP